MKWLMLAGTVSLVIGITLMINTETFWLKILGFGLVGFSYGLAWRN